MDGTNPTNGGSNIDSKHGWSDSQSMVLDAEHHQDNRFAIRIDQIVHPIAVLSSGIVTKDDVHARQMLRHRSLSGSMCSRKRFANAFLTLQCMTSKHLCQRF